MHCVICVTMQCTRNNVVRHSDATEQDPVLYLSYQKYTRPIDRLTLEKVPTFVSTLKLQ